MASVLELITYPVKGCAGTSVAATTLTDAGLAHDRTFMVLDESGEARTQRRNPRLALVKSEVGEDGDRLTLTAPGIEPLGFETVRGAVPNQRRREVTLFGKPLSGIDQGDPAADWFTRVLGAPSRLVRVPPDHDRISDGQTPGPVGYADGFAILLASPPSLDLLNERLAERGGQPLPMDRFRPNIVVGGWDRPHTEDLARRIGIGGAELGYAKLCLRCAVTMVDQASAVPSGPEPIRALSGYRRANGGVAFGANFSVTKPGDLAVGDEVQVSSWGESVLAQPG
ncbi:MAG TPA: MOSC N-terminal beta barrel domain-containing protein [Actinocrinis sp.]|nr:MOSC N-terminal beta barrel domain-containing protein [Actinocrinis sp.]